MAYILIYFVAYSNRSLGVASRHYGPTALPGSSQVDLIRVHLNDETRVYV